MGHNTRTTTHWCSISSIVSISPLKVTGIGISFPVVRTNPTKLMISKPWNYFYVTCLSHKNFLEGRFGHICHHYKSQSEYGSELLDTSSSAELADTTFLMKLKSKKNIEKMKFHNTALSGPHKRHITTLETP